MPTSDTNKKRVGLRLDLKLVARIENFRKRNSISFQKAAEELLDLGLDAEMSGVESVLNVQQKLSRDLHSIRGLIAAAIDAADTSSALSLIHQIQAGVTTPDQLSAVFKKSRKLAKTQIKQLKKDS